MAVRPASATLSGHGNNQANPNWGSADTPFIRITNAHYGAPDANGNLAINPIFAGLDPRTISNILGAQEADLPHAGNDANIFFMAFGQYFDHGLDFLGKGGNGTIQIGAPGGGAPGSGNPADLTRGTVAGYDENGVPQHINQHLALRRPEPGLRLQRSGRPVPARRRRQRRRSARICSPARPIRPTRDFNLLPTLRELIEHHWENNTVFHSASAARRLGELPDLLRRAGRRRRHQQRDAAGA